MLCCRRCTHLCAASDETGAGEIHETGAGGASIGSGEAEEACADEPIFVSGDGFRVFKAVFMGAYFLPWLLQFLE
jgi:hypothetical protein